MLKRPKIGHDDITSRQAVLWMHPTALLPFMTSQRWVVTENHLPEDIQFHYVFWEPQRQIFGIVCMSKEFKPVMVGKALPELEQVSFRFWNPAKDGAIE